MAQELNDWVELKMINNYQTFIFVYPTKVLFRENKSLISVYWGTDLIDNGALLIQSKPKVTAKAN